MASRSFGAALAFLCSSRAFVSSSTCGGVIGVIVRGS